MVKKFIQNDEANAVPLILFVVTIVCIGALYSFFFLEVGYPLLAPLVPASDYKTFIMMCMYAIPMFVLIVGVVALIVEGVKRKGYEVYP